MNPLYPVRSAIDRAYTVPELSDLLIIFPYILIIP